MIDFENLTESQKDFMNDLIFESAENAGFFCATDNKDCAIFSAGEHGEVDITENIYAFAIHIVEQLNLMTLPTITTKQ
jgi:hypothetical protein